MGFGPSIVLATIVTAGLAAFIGVGALRVRGLLLAVSTFAFGVAASQYFYQRPILSAGQVESVPFLRASLFGLNTQSQRTYYYVVLAVLAVGVDDHRAACGARASAARRSACATTPKARRATPSRPRG